MSRADTKKRELASLTAAMTKFKPAHARIVTLDTDAVLETEMGQVKASSFWRCVLEKNRE